MRSEVYSVAEIEITDRSWIPEYVKNVTRLVEQRGGRYLARMSKVEKIEGQRNVPQVFLIIEWPSREVAEAFYGSDEYRPYRQARMKGARNEFLLVAGEDMGRVTFAPDLSSLSASCRLRSQERVKPGEVSQDPQLGDH